MTDYATVANAIAAFEPVTMIANAGRDAADARAACAAGVEIVELGLDDSWLRDCGPIYVVDDDGASRTAVHFGFNAWGEKFPPWDRDAAVGRLIAEHLGDPVVDGGMVLEGGSILTDGAGTLLTTEQCLLNPNRNPSMSREEIEATLRDRLGVGSLLWLGMGLLEDRDTDGHVDLIAAFTKARRGAAADGARGQPEPPPLSTKPLSTGVLWGTGGGAAVSALRHGGGGDGGGQLPEFLYLQRRGDRARGRRRHRCGGAQIIAGCYPGREVVPVPGLVLAYGGGGPHCITQQVPLTNGRA